MTIRLVVKDGSGRKPPVPPGGKSGKRRRRKWQADLFIQAVSRNHYPERAHGIDEIRIRMNKLSKRVTGTSHTFTNTQVAYINQHIKEHKFFYGCCCAAVQKGAFGEYRSYVLVLCEWTHESKMIFVVDDEDFIAIKKGAISSGRTTATMLRNEADALEFVDDLADGDFTELATAFRGASNRTEAALAKAAKYE